MAVIVIKKNLFDENGMLDKTIAQGLCQCIGKGHKWSNLNGKSPYGEFAKNSKISWVDGNNHYEYELPESISILGRKTNNPTKKSTVEDDEQRYHVIVGEEILGEGAFKRVRKVSFDIKTKADQRVYEIKSSKKVGAFVSKPALYTESDFQQESQYISEVADDKKRPQMLEINTKPPSNNQKTLPSSQTVYKSVILSRFINGKELFKIIEANKNTLGFADFLVIANEIKLALDRFHNMKCVHHDLKPENILFDSHEGKAHLIDFQYSNKIGDTGEKISTGGTPAYAAPERKAGKRYNIVNKSSDYYSFGLILKNLYYCTAACKQATPEENEEVNRVIRDFTNETPFSRPHSLTSGCKSLDKMLDSRLTKAYSNMEVFINANLDRINGYKGTDVTKRQQFNNMKKMLDDAKKELKQPYTYQNYIKAYNKVHAAIQNVDRDILSTFKKGTVLHFVAKHFFSKPVSGVVKANSSSFFKPKSLKVVNEIEKSFHRMESHAPNTLKGR